MAKCGMNYFTQEALFLKYSIRIKYCSCRRSVVRLWPVRNLCHCAVYWSMEVELWVGLNLPYTLNFQVLSSYVHQLLLMNEKVINHVIVSIPGRQALYFQSVKCAPITLTSSDIPSRTYPLLAYHLTMSFLRIIVDCLE